MHQPAQSPIASLSLQHPPPPSHATLLSLRGGDNRITTSSIDDTSFDDVDIRDCVRPPPSAFTAATAYDPHSLSPVGHYAPRHQRSMTDTFLDNCRTTATLATSTIQQHTSKASFPSPTKSLASFIPSRRVIESTASQPKIRAGAKVISNWFNGSSGPVSLGVSPTSSVKGESLEEYYSSDEEEADATMIAGMWNRAPALTRSATSNETPSKPSTPTPAKPHTPNSSGKFAWLLNAQKNSVIPPNVPLPTYHNPDDELLNLKITTSLFPHGAVDPLDPASFHDLLSNAEKLLSRYQCAYRDVSSALADTRAEQSAQDDELDEADTRARHLKMQLETMAARATEQEAEMRKLKEELAFERLARQEEEAARKRSLSLAKDSESPRRRNRVSNSDVSIADSGFESDVENDAASTFSRELMSPTGAVPSSAASEFDSQHETTPKGKKPSLFQQQSTHNKVRNGSVKFEQGGWGCANCEGGSQSAVWGRLAREREENSHLRTRVESLEEAVENALNVVDGPWGI
jgi:hypothetical protein